MKLTSRMVEVELMKHFGIRQHIIVPNVFWGLGFRHELDLCILSKSGYATEVEIKVTKSDLKRDKEKSHNHESKYLKNLYFAVPEKLVEFALTEIPERAGLLGIYERNNQLWVKRERMAKSQSGALKWPKSHIQKLSELGTMRLLGLMQTNARLNQENKDLRQKLKAKEKRFKV